MAQPFLADRDPSPGMALSAFFVHPAPSAPPDLRTDFLADLMDPLANRLGRPANGKLMDVSPLSPKKDILCELPWSFGDMFLRLILDSSDFSSQSSAPCSAKRKRADARLLVTATDFQRSKLLRYVDQKSRKHSPDGFIPRSSKRPRTVRDDHWSKVPIVALQSSPQLARDAQNVLYVVVLDYCWIDEAAPLLLDRLAEIVQYRIDRCLPVCIVGDPNDVGDNTRWLDIIRTLKRFQSFGHQLQHFCRHGAVVRTDMFNHQTDCSRDCGVALPCGHLCRQRCHYADHSELICMDPCNKPRYPECGHPCTQKCFSCGIPGGYCYSECQTPVTLSLSCGHEITVECSTALMELPSACIDCWCNYSLIWPSDELYQKQSLRHLVINQEETTHLKVHFTALKSYYNQILKEPADKMHCLEILTNSELRETYSARREEMKTQLGRQVVEKLVFHGTTQENIDSISKTGLLIGGVDVKMKNGCAKGRGIYCSLYPSVAEKYARYSGDVIVAALAIIEGLESRESRSSIVIPKSNQVLPLYIIHSHGRRPWRRRQCGRASRIRKAPDLRAKSGSLT